VTTVLLPQQLAATWEDVVRGRLTAAEYEQERERLLAEYRQQWRRALVLPGREDLVASLSGELTDYLEIPADEVARLGRDAAERIEREWKEQVSLGAPDSIERFYDRAEVHLHELTWWHTLAEDDSPLAYVVALRFAEAHSCYDYLDFGSGVGSAGILFARAGFSVCLADISSALLDFSRWRLQARGLDVQHLDLKHQRLPAEAFDIVTAMDVFEHLVDPVAAVDEIWRTLRPGGFLFGRFAATAEDPRAEHIVTDFEPVFHRMEELAMAEVWEDAWLWGHQAFRKAT
jgi:2-polyprenyl-3-methyl-5-hydroxy-6-metoxy-1,4-benzoquinol methylase